MNNDSRQSKRVGWARPTFFVIIILALPLLSSLLVRANDPTTSPTDQLEIFPTELKLQSSRDRQKITARLLRPDGISLDVTKDAQITVADLNIAKADKNIISPVNDGATELRITVANQTKSIPIHVKDAKADRPISFRLDVAPVFMAAGCNTGACHGSARGKDGFRLSLFGFDPEGDYFRLTREISLRRINLAQPTESLLLQKALGKVPHSGGKRFDENSEYYATLLRWLEAGAPNDKPDVAKPVSLELLPTQIVLEGEGAHQQLLARATYSDGTQRDVTDLAFFLTTNDNSAKITQGGLITAANRGEAFITARFGTFTVGSQVIVIPKGLKYDPPTLENNYIDKHINAKLQKLRVTPSNLCSDEQFIRRATIDITGQLPTRAEFDQFIANKEPTKREKLVDELLSRHAFVDMQVMKWCELLTIRTSDRVTAKSAMLYYNWLKERMESNQPFDKIVRDILASNGGTFENPASAYYHYNNETLKLAENTAQVFMGVRTQCAQCHNHPFDRWTMDDYYGFASFFSQIARKAGEDPRELFVFNSGGGEVNHPVLGKPIPPKFLGGASPDTNGKDRRQVLADWLTTADNPYFARNLANILWQQFFGRGIVEPVDDVRISNPPSNPELLNALTAALKSYNYDFHRLARDICTSRTYQLDTRTNESNQFDDRNFSHATVRRMRAEVLLDCIAQATETSEKFRGLPLGARAIELNDGAISNYFLSVFGRAKRESVCSCEVAMQPSLSQALHLLNGDTIQNRINDSKAIKRILEEKQTPDQIITDLYIRCYSRPPSTPELAKLKSMFPAPSTQPTTQQTTDDKNMLIDLYWSILNSQEFLFNH